MGRHLWVWFHVLKIYNVAVPKIIMFHCRHLFGISVYQLRSEVSAVMKKQAFIHVLCQTGTCSFSIIKHTFVICPQFSTDFYKLFKNFKSVVWVCLTCLLFLSVYLLKNTAWCQRVKHLFSVCVQCALVIIENMTVTWPRHVSRLMRKCWTVRIKYIIIGFLNL